MIPPKNRFPFHWNFCCLEKLISFLSASVKVSVSVSVASAVFSFSSAGKVVRWAAQAAAGFHRSATAAVVVSVVARPAAVLVPGKINKSCEFVNYVSHCICFELQLNYWRWNRDVKLCVQLYGKWSTKYIALKNLLRCICCAQEKFTSEISKSKTIFVYLFRRLLCFFETDGDSGLSDDLRFFLLFFRSRRLLLSPRPS